MPLGVNISQIWPSLCYIVLKKILAWYKYAHKYFMGGTHTALQQWIYWLYNACKVGYIYFGYK